MKRATYSNNYKFKLRHNVKDSSKRMLQILRTIKRLAVKQEDLSTLESVKKLQAMCPGKAHTSVAVVILIGIAMCALVTIVLCTQLHSTLSCSNSTSSHEMTVQATRPQYFVNVVSEEDGTTDVKQFLTNSDDVEEPQGVVGEYPLVSSRLWLQRDR